MNEAITLLLEDNDGKMQETSCSRFAIMLDGKELWVQNIGGQLFIGTDVAEDDQEFTNLVLRPLATNLVSLQLEMEAMEEGAALPDEEDDCCGNHGCGCH